MKISEIITTTLREDSHTSGSLLDGPWYAVPPEQIELVVKNLVMFIKKHAAPWLAAAGNTPVYRGTYRVPNVNQHNQSLAFVKSVRSDREPRDSSVRMHRAFNWAIESIGGVANRSNSAFVTPSETQAEAYGYVFVYFPLGKFHYTWSNIFQDWATDFGEHSISNMLTDEFQPKRGQSMPIIMPKSVNDFDPVKVARSIICDEDLTYALTRQSEIMVASTSGLYLDPHLYEHYIAGDLL